MAADTRHGVEIDPVAWARNWFGRNNLALLVVAGLVGLWWTYSNLINTRGDAYFPSIEYTVSQSLEFSNLLVEGIWTTTAEVTVGFLLSIVIGTALGIVFAESFVIRQASLPALVFTYSVPHAVMAPLFIIWFGRGLFGIGLFVAWFGFFQVLINTITGFTQVNEEFKHLGEVVDASRWQMIKKIKFWAALPHIAGGIKVAVQQSIIGAVIAEFIASGGGLGFLILNSLLVLREGLTFGVLIVLMVFAVIFYKVVTVLVDVLVPGPGGV
ncbi:MAG: ABC transporter permease [Haloferacaceae archaeon]